MAHPLNPDLVPGDIVQLVGAAPFDGKWYEVERVTPNAQLVQFGAAPYTPAVTIATVSVTQAEPKIDFVAGKGGEVNQMLFGVAAVDSLTTRAITSGSGTPLRLLSLYVGVYRSGQSPLFVDPNRAGGDNIFTLHVNLSPPEAPSRKFCDYAVKGDKNISLTARNLEPFTIGTTSGVTVFTAEGITLSVAQKQDVFVFHNLYGLKFYSETTPDHYAVFQRQPAIQV